MATGLQPLATAIYDLPPNEVLRKFFAKSVDWDKRLATHLARKLVAKELYHPTPTGTPQKKMRS